MNGYDEVPQTIYKTVAENIMAKHNRRKPTTNILLDDLETAKVAMEKAAASFESAVSEIRGG